MGVECVSRTHVGLRRKINEDAYLALSDRGLWAVADGMGGHEAGDVASALIVEALAHLPVTSGVESLVDDSITALVRVNRSLLRLARSGDRQRTIGSTAVGLAVEGDRFGCFWVGDSRAYRLREGGIAQLTRDHSLVQDLVDAGMLAAEEAKSHPNANVVTRAVGVSDTLKVDTVAGDVRPGDVFLLASDGVTAVLGAEEILEIVNAQPLEQAADSIIATVLDRGAPDNTTLILVRPD